MNCDKSLARCFQLKIHLIDVVNLNEENVWGINKNFQIGICYDIDSGLTSYQLLRREFILAANWVKTWNAIKENQKNWAIDLLSGLEGSRKAQQVIETM